MTDHEQKCSNCKFFDERNCDIGYGECLRYPPLDIKVLHRFPITLVGDWCGEWQPCEKLYKLAVDAIREGQVSCVNEWLDLNVPTPNLQLEPGERES